MIDVKQKLIDIGFLANKAKKSGKFMRCGTIYKPNGSSGWFVVGDDFVSYGDWSENVESGYFFINDKPLTQHEKQEYAKRKSEHDRMIAIELEKEIKERKESIKTYTKDILPKITTSADTHKYLIKKNAIKRWDMHINDKDQLLIPVYDKTGDVVGYQVIDDEKRFVPGSVLSASFYPFRNPVTNITDVEWIILCEGIATGDAMDQILENYTDSKFFMVVSGFNAGNLPKVAQVFNELCPRAEKICIADNDPIGVKNAKLTGWNWFTMSAFEKGDVNDTLCDFGLDAATDLFHAQLKQLNKKHSNSDF